MKLETTGNVIGFPDVGARNGYALKRKQGVETAGEEQSKAGFFSLLRTNLEDAEQIVSTLEPGGERLADEGEASRREEMVDISYFGTLMGAVATKMASSSLEDAPRSWGQAISEAGPKIIDIANEFANGGEALEAGQDPSSGDDFAGLQARLAAARISPRTDKDTPGSAPLKVLEISLPGQAQAEAQAAAQKSHSFVIQGDTKVITPKLSGQVPSGTAKHQDAVSDIEDAADTVVPFRGSARADAKADGKQLQQGTSDSPDDTAANAATPQPVQTDADIFSTRISDKPPSQQIADNIRQAIPAVQSQPLQGGEKTGTIRFKLHPENLGEIEVNLKIRGDKLEIGIVMERGDAASAVRLAQDDLRRGLGEQGLNLEMVDISVARPIRETSSSSQSDLMQQGNQQPARQDAQAGSSGGAFSGRSGAQSGAQGQSGAGRENGNGNTQRFAEETAPRNARNGVFL